MRRILVAVYRISTFVYPPAFRRSCGPEMIEAFRRRLNDVVATRGLLGRLRFGARIVRDVGTTALAEWRDVFADRSRLRLGGGSMVRPNWWMHLSREFRHATRMIRKRPGMSLTAVITLTFGIALTTTMYAIAAGFRAQLPFRDAGRIMHVALSSTLNPDLRHLASVREFLAWRETQSSFAGLAAYRTGQANVGRTGIAARNVEVTEITANTFDLLGIVPSAGRGFGADDRPADRVTVLSHDLWQHAFDGSAAIGQTVRIRGQTYTVVGVMPQGFVFPVKTSAWIPVDLALLADADATTERGWFAGVNVFGRLQSDVTPSTAGQELERVSLNVYAGQQASGENVRVQPFADWYVDASADVLMYMMLFATVAVLMIACFNVANLLLARTIVRSRELAVRSALGANRRVIVGSLLCESSVLSFLGASSGILLAALAVEGIDRATSLAELPFWITFELDLRVLGFVAAITVLSGLVAGMLPAIQATRSDINAVLQDESRGSTGFRMGRVSNFLVVTEVILSCGLLLAGGFIARNMIEVASADLHYETENILTARLELTSEQYADRARRADLLRSLEERLISDPDVAAAAISTELPAMGRPGGRVRLESDAPDAVGLPMTRDVSVSPGFMETFRLELVQGEPFTSASFRRGSDVVMINETFAAEAFPGRNPVGQRLQVLYEGGEPSWLTVIGVLPDLWIPDAPVEQEGKWCLYRPLGSSSHVFVSIRGAVTGAPLLQTLQTELAILDSDLALTNVTTMKFIASRHLLFYAAFGSAFIISGGVSLFLAIVGLYAVISFSVSRRTHEVGIRIALGAASSRVVGLVLKQGINRLAIGLVCGTILGAFLARALAAIMRSMSPSSMSSLEPLDPVVFGTILSLMALTGILACIIPARRAARVDPMVAFRAE